jgi:hypothetical protein
MKDLFTIIYESLVLAAFLLTVLALVYVFGPLLNGR